MTDTPTIIQFYENKSIFVTGGSGFIGKVLIEKLLRSCPGIKKIYLLLRPKKGRNLQQRLASITDCPLFDLLKSQNGDALKKLVPVNGDVTKLGLGLSPQDLKTLTEEVNIVFHSAASVRFDDPLVDAIIINTRGAREVMLLAAEIKNLAVLIHVSTTYCQSDKKVIGEQFYPAHADWRKSIELAENADRRTMDILTEKYIQPLCNTYTFTKSMAENVVYDLGNGKIPVVIIRPSIVISTDNEPISGWIDNFNGPVGLLTACGKGIIRTVYSDPKIITDYVPVDYLVKVVIIATWHQSVKKDPTERLKTTFYNASNNDVQPITLEHMVNMGKTVSSEIPFNNILWYPDTSVDKCYYYHFLKFFFYQLLPAFVIDGILKLIGHKPLLTKIQRRIYVANMAIQYFVQNQWSFMNEEIIKIERSVLPSDAKEFAFIDDLVPALDYLKKAAMGGRRYLLKEGDESLEQARVHSRRMWFIAKFFNSLWYFALLWLIFVKIDVLSVIQDKYYDVCNYFLSD